MSEQQEQETGSEAKLPETGALSPGGNEGTVEDTLELASAGASHPPVSASAGAGAGADNGSGVCAVSDTVVASSSGGPANARAADADAGTVTSAAARRAIAAAATRPLSDREDMFDDGCISSATTVVRLAGGDNEPEAVSGDPSEPRPPPPRAFSTTPPSRSPPVCPIANEPRGREAGGTEYPSPSCSGDGSGGACRRS